MLRFVEMQRHLLILALASACGRSPLGLLETSTEAARCQPLRLASVGALAASPRPDRDAELLALFLSPSRPFVIDDETYARAVRDVTSLRALGRHFVFLPPWVDEFEVDFDAEGFAQVVAGEYDAWDCLNEGYRVRPGRTFAGSGGGTVLLQVEPRLRLPRLAEEYEQLPHVLVARASGVPAEEAHNPTICLDVAPDGTWLWLGENWQNNYQTAFRFSLETRPDHTGTVWSSTAPTAPAAWAEAMSRCQARAN